MSVVTRTPTRNENIIIICERMIYDLYINLINESRLNVPKCSYCSNNEALTSLNKIGYKCIICEIDINMHRIRNLPDLNTWDAYKESLLAVIDSVDLISEDNGIDYLDNPNIHKIVHNMKVFLADKT